MILLTACIPLILDDERYLKNTEGVYSNTKKQIKKVLSFEVPDMNILKINLAKTCR